MDRRVVVTGIGLVTPIGTGKDAFWDALVSGVSGVRRVDDLVDLSEIDVKIGAIVASFDPLKYMDKRRARRIDRSTQFALVASKLALDDAGLSPSDLPLERTAAIAGTGIGGLQTMEENFAVLAEHGPHRVSPFFVPRLMPNAIAGQIAIEYGMRGPNFGVVSACASSAHAIGIASELIRSGLCDVAVAGGSEAALVRIAYAGFTKIGALSSRNDEPQRASRPFDKNRDGFIMGEGGGFIILEERERALKRDAHIYGELVGFGMSADAEHITAPAEDGAGAVKAMRMAIDRAGIATPDVDYINAHGTSTILNDKIETLAIKTVFGAGAKNVKISSTKSQTGHLLGAAGAVEAIATLLSMEHGVIPATRNYETPDPECDLDYTPRTVEKKVDVAMSNSFGFGGQNASLLFKKSK
ncbi:MAG TPA: beta-ketoacyl-[acyl-carrier-protein] synthase II [Candidatus Acetothermia bacterium]|nr:beta-ketoacyl-[acyl-carrier-protein] synthase II [Candidatus Acetothermia bacterium]